MTPTNPLEAFAARILELSEKATPGPWEWQTGSSWTRLGTRHGRRTDGSVICPFVNQYDHHPDLAVKNCDATLITELRNHATTLAAIASAAAECERALEEIIPYARVTIGAPESSWNSDNVILQARSALAAIAVVKKEMETP